MVKTSTPKNYLVTSPDAKFQPKIVIRKQKKEANEYCLHSSKAR
jgi:hypothetical protein